MESPAARSLVTAWPRRRSVQYAVGILGGTLLGATLWGLLFWFQLGAPTELSRWPFEILSHKHRRANSLNGPRIVLLGGSNVLFGVRAQLIEESLGIPTVNFGSHAGLGRRYLLGQSRRALRPGDTAILALEYELYAPDDPSEVLVDYVVSRDPGYLPRMTLVEQARIVFGLHPVRLAEGWVNKFRPPLPRGDGYSSRTLNAWGDETRNRSEPSELDLARVRGVQPRAFSVGGSITGDSAADLLAFRDWCRARSIRLLATFPSDLDFPEYHVQSARETSDRLSRWYRDHQIAVLGEPADFLYSIDECFDSGYHLTDKAAVKRTRFLIEKLRSLGVGTSRPEPESSGA